MELFEKYGLASHLSFTDKMWQQLSYHHKI